MWEISPERLKAAMDRARMTQSQLAEAVGLQQPSIGRLLKGETKTTRVLDKLAKALGTTPEDLTGEDESPSKALTDRQLPYRGASPPPPDDLVYVAEIDLRFGLGAAIMDEDILEHQAEMLPFANAWLRTITTSPPSKLYWARGQVNSMEPLISEGDIILIDRSQRSPGFGDLYWAIAYGHTGMVKRLRPMPDGSVKILSDNQSVPPEVAYDGELHIFGRVIAVVKRI